MIYKNEIKILATGLFALTVVSCSDILEKEPILDTSSSIIFASHSKIKSNLEGLYATLGSGIPSYFFETDYRGEDIERIIDNGGLNSYDMNISVDGSSSAWNSMYKAIGETNVFLNHLADAKEVVGDDYERLKSEALFIRALSYYYLNVLYARTYKLFPDAKSVPIRLGTDETENNDLAASTIEEVHSQILSDLSDSNISFLGEEVGTLNGITHATKAAAYVLRQRIYLEREDWNNVIAEGEKIKGYSLVDLRTVFTTPYITNEGIFSFPYSDKKKNSLAGSYYVGNNVAIDDNYGITANPLYKQQQDVRISDLSIVRGDRITIAKYTDRSTGTDWIPVFRYAEVLLNLSEAYYNIGNEAKAKELLLLVRRRSIAKSADALDETKLSGTTLRDAIYNERRLEFLGEGIRSIDIHRRGEIFLKRAGSLREIKVLPTDKNYIWPIPLSETTQNKLLTADN